MKKLKVKFFVNEEKRTVTAVADNISFDAIGALDLTFSGVPRKIDLALPNTIHAVARCHPCDAWDEEIGKDVAWEKLRVHYEKLIRAKCREYIQYLEKEKERAEKVFAKAEKESKSKYLEEIKNKGSIPACR